MPVVVVLLPPQATNPAASKAKTSEPKASFTRRLLPGISSRKMAANSAPALGINQRGPLNRRKAVDGAVVATTRLEEPEPVPDTAKDPGVSVHVV